MRPDAEYQLPVFVFTGELAPVEAEAARYLGERRSLHRLAAVDALADVARGAVLEFIPKIDGITARPTSHLLRWEGDTRRAEFRLTASADGPDVRRGRLTVHVNGLILAEIPLAIRVDQDAAADLERAVVTAARLSVFASYAHEDGRVVEMAAAFLGSLGMEQLRDVADLRSGEEWDPRLEELIEQADLFQLFWSWQAASSRFVESEWRHALSLARPGDFIRPCRWEDPWPDPPAELSHLHFQPVAIRD